MSPPPQWGVQYGMQISRLLCDDLVPLCAHFRQPRPRPRPRLPWRRASPPGPLPAVITTSDTTSTRLGQTLGRPQRQWTLPCLSQPRPRHQSRPRPPPHPSWSRRGLGSAPDRRGRDLAQGPRLPGTRPRPRLGPPRTRRLARSAPRTRPPSPPPPPSPPCPCLAHEENVVAARPLSTDQTVRLRMPSVKLRMPSVACAPAWAALPHH